MSFLTELLICCFTLSNLQSGIHPIVTVSSLSLEDGQEKGSLVVNDLIELLNPKYLFCGHAHKSQGSEWIGATLTVNPGALKYGSYCLVEGDKVEFEKVV